MQDTNKWTAEQHAAAKAEFALYKSDLRPLIRDADMYHIEPRPDGVHWDATEYFDPSRGKGVIYAFRGTAPGDTAHVLKLQGLLGQEPLSRAIPRPHVGRHRNGRFGVDGGGRQGRASG